MGRTRMGRTDGRTDGLTDGRTRRRLYAPPKFFGEHNKHQLVLFDVTGLPTDNVPRELATCFREVLDNSVTIHGEIMANQPLAPHLGLSNTKFAVVSFFHTIT